MKAAFTPSYGPASTLEIRDMPTPTLGVHEVLVEVHASAVTEGDRRLRSADFPGMTAIPGRLMMGVFGPRHAVQGTMFAGRVTAIGTGVTRYAVGDEVFGGADHGAYAELLAMHEDGPMAHKPTRVDFGEAAAIPYGAGTARHFLGELARVQPGERVLIVGASGGVGRFAVQFAKHLGAQVTGVASTASLEAVRKLGADTVIDYTQTDFTTQPERYDVIFDIAGATGFAACRHCLVDTGRYMTVYLGLGVLLHMGWTSLTGGPRALFAIAMPSREDLDAIAELVFAGVFTASVAKRFPLDRIAEAHAYAESQRTGTVVVSLDASA